MKSLLVLLAACALAAAMVPRERTPVPASSSTEKAKQICARQTPCAWAVYKTSSKIIDFNFTNSYCICGPGTECVKNEDDMSVSAFVYRCREPSEDNENDNDS